MKTPGDLTIVCANGAISPNQREVPQETHIDPAINTETKPDCNARKTKTKVNGVISWVCYSRYLRMGKGSTESLAQT